MENFPDDLSSCFTLQKEPTDSDSVVQTIFFMWGVGALLPWNAVLSAFDFFGSEMNGFQPAFIYPFGVFLMTTFSQFLMLIYGNKLSDSFKV